MRPAFLSLALATSLAACGQAPGDGPPVAQKPPPPSVEQARQTEKSAEQGKPLDDTSLKQIVRAALESESSLDARRIDVENRDGNIALHGQVESEEQREKAGRIVASVGGVTGVDNRLEVAPSASTGASQGAIAGGSPLPPLDPPKPLELPK